MPVEIEGFKRSVKEGVMLSVVCFSIFAETSSCPVNLDVSSAVRRSNMESSVHSKFFGHSRLDGDLHKHNQCQRRNTVTKATVKVIV